MAVSAEQQKLDIEARRWRNRRRMAWWAFIVASAITVLVVVSMLTLWLTGEPEQTRAAADWGIVLLGLLGGLWGVVMAYIGSAAYSDVRLWK